MKLKNKTALVTGAARGIGQAICVELARAGADVFALDLDAADLEKTELLVQKEGRRFEAFAGDVAEEKAMQKCIDEIFMLYGGFDVLVNNAGVIASGPFARQEWWTIRRVLEIDLLAVIHLTRFSLPYLRKRREAHIVNIASIAGKFGTEGLAAYCAAKHGIVGFSSALREELRDSRIGVSWICPSYVQTRLVEGIRRTFLTPMMQPEQVARAVRRAIEKNQGEVMCPRIMRLTVAAFPSMFPRLSRRILRLTGASRGWLDVRRDTIVDR